MYTYIYIYIHLHIEASVHWKSYKPLPAIASTLREF